MTGYILRWFTRPQMVTHPSTNPAAHGRKSTSQPVDHIIITLPSHLIMTLRAACAIPAVCLRRVMQIMSLFHFTHGGTQHEMKACYHGPEATSCQRFSVWKPQNIVNVTVVYQTFIVLLDKSTHCPHVGQSFFSNLLNSKTTHDKYRLSIQVALCLYHRLRIKCKNNFQCVLKH